jgi:predicted unusual protein kinase regulating ubiquinone biosynthesis (AarF/ABC1/UbiB family)
MMAKGNFDSRQRIAAELLADQSELPTSTARRLARNGLGFARTFLMMRRGAKKGADALDPQTIAKVVRSFGQLKGLGMKMAQILSYIDIDVPEPLREALSALQTHSTPMPLATVQQILAEDLPSEAADELAAGLEPTPLAAASIGQVHRATLADGRPVAVKVRYPEIEAALLADLGPSRIGVTVAKLMAPGADVAGFVDEMRERFVEECDYGHEAARQRRFGELFAGHPRIVVPAVHDGFCGKRVLTTELCEGRDFESYLATDPPQEERDRVGETLFEFYIATLFRHGLYHADPHPGNYLFRDDGKLVLLDYGCTRRFEPAFVGKLARLTRAVHRDDEAALAESYLDLEMQREGRAGRRFDPALARRLLRSFYGPMLDDRVQAVQLGSMDFATAARGKRQLINLNLPREFLFLFRIRFGLLSVLARLGARANWYRLEQAAVAAALE